MVTWIYFTQSVSEIDNKGNIHVYVWACTTITTISIVAKSGNINYKEF